MLWQDEVTLAWVGVVPNVGGNPMDDTNHESKSQSREKKNETKRTAERRRVLSASPDDR